MGFDNKGTNFYTLQYPLRMQVSVAITVLGFVLGVKSYLI